VRPFSRISVLAALALFTAAAPGCAGRRGKQDRVSAPAERTVVRVENQGFSDMTIYVLRGGTQRIRLGLANGNRTSVFEIPRYLVSFPTSLRFIADPIGSNRTPVSDEIAVNPGDEVVLTIPPS
jgi:hypothetical protein